MTTASDIEQQAFDTANKSLLTLEELARQLEAMPIEERLPSSAINAREAPALPRARVYCVAPHSL